MNLIIINKKDLLRNTCIICLVLTTLFLSKNQILNVFNELSTPKCVPISNVDTSENIIALTFEVNFQTSELDKTLKILEENNIESTFFVVGNWANNNIDSVKQIHDKGHQIGNHTLTHSNISTIKESELKSEINACNQIINKILGITPTIFKYPSINYNESQTKCIYDMGITPIEPNIISNDYKEYGTTDIVENIINNKNLKNGSIIEFNVGSKYLNEALPEIITKLKEMNFRFVTIDSLLYKENCIVDSNGTQKLNNN